MVLPGLAAGGVVMGFTLKSADFREGDRIPEVYTCEGRDTSPELNWEDPPEGTQGYVLVTEDPDAPGGTFIHWVLFDIPASARNLAGGAGDRPDPAGALKHGRTSFGRAGYGGPCPPRGHGTHRYIFILKALDIKTLGLRQGAGKADVDRAIQGHVLGEARVMGTFSR
jgi:Raf kinase inhibitor-like YbhB/YbcL family protein